MSKRVFLGGLAVLTGLLLFTTIQTAPIGFLFAGAGAYLLALPYVGEESTTNSPGRHHGNPSQRR